MRRIAIPVITYGDEEVNINNLNQDIVNHDTNNDWEDDRDDYIINGYDWKNDIDINYDDPTNDLSSDPFYDPFEQYNDDED